jgi:transcription antitermination factor NusG
MLALSDNPPVLPPGLRSVAEAAGRWWVAHTKARCEKALAADLLAQRVAYFLPMTQRLTVSGGRTRRGMAPLFPSYVFFCAEDGSDARYRAAATGRLCGVIRVADQGQLIRELSGVERALAAQAPLEPYPFAATGHRCRVTAGPFRGLEGTVAQRVAAPGSSRGRQTRIVLEVGMLGRGVAMEIDAALLEPAGDEAGNCALPLRRGVALGAAG